VLPARGENDMRCYRAGDKGRALCASDGRVSTTYRHRTVVFGDGTGTAARILAGVCDRCGRVVSIPAQSVSSVGVARTFAANGEGLL
jgi:hypothetical protein